MKHTANALLCTACAAMLLVACGNQPVDLGVQITTASSAATEAAGTTVSALTTTTVTTTDTTAQSTAETVSTTEFTIPELPEITLTMPSQSTAESITTTSVSTETAQSVSSQTAVTVGKAFTFEAENVTVAAGAKKVPFSLQIHNNTGFSSAVFTVSYGALLPVGDSKTHDAEITEGMKTGGVVSCMFNNDTQLMAYALMAKKDCTADGSLFTVYFDLPAGAKSGDTFPVSIKISACTNAAGKMLSPEVINGVIRVK